MTARTGLRNYFETERMWLHRSLANYASKQCFLYISEKGPREQGPWDISKGPWTSSQSIVAPFQIQKFEAFMLKGMPAKHVLRRKSWGSRRTSESNRERM